MQQLTLQLSALWRRGPAVAPPRRRAASAVVVVVVVAAAAAVDVALHVFLLGLCVSCSTSDAAALSQQRSTRADVFLIKNLRNSVLAPSVTTESGYARSDGVFVFFVLMKALTSQLVTSCGTAEPCVCIESSKSSI